MQVMPTATNNSVPRHVIDRHAGELSPFTESEPHFIHPTHNRAAIAETTLSHINDTCTTADAMPDGYGRSDIRIRFIWVNRLEVITNTHGQDVGQSQAISSLFHYNITLP